MYAAAPAVGHAGCSAQNEVLGCRTEASWRRPGHVPPDKDVGSAGHLPTDTTLESAEHCSWDSPAAWRVWHFSRHPTRGLCSDHQLRPAECQRPSHDVTEMYIRVGMECEPAGMPLYST